MYVWVHVVSGTVKCLNIKEFGFLQLFVFLFQSVFYTKT